MTNNEDLFGEGRGGAYKRGGLFERGGDKQRFYGILFLPWTIQLCLRSVDKVCSKLGTFL